jgi:hypothetical protein
MRLLDERAFFNLVAQRKLGDHNGAGKDLAKELESMTTLSRRLVQITSSGHDGEDLGWYWGIYNYGLYLLY